MTDGPAGGSIGHFVLLWSNFARRAAGLLNAFPLTRYSDRNYDRSTAGLGTGKAQRYFASDVDRLSSRLCDADGIAAVSRWWRLAGVQQRGTACVRSVRHCSTAPSKNQ